MNEFENFIIILLALWSPTVAGIMIYDAIKDLNRAKEIESRIKKEPHTGDEL